MLFFTSAYHTSVRKWNNTHWLWTFHIYIFKAKITVMWRWREKKMTRESSKNPGAKVEPAWGIQYYTYSTWDISSTNWVSLLYQVVKQMKKMSWQSFSSDEHTDSCQQYRLACFVLYDCWETGLTSSWHRAAPSKEKQSDGQTLSACQISAHLIKVDGNLYIILLSRVENI